MIDRRSLLTGTGAAGLLALAGCGSSDNEQASAETSWTFTDDRGTKVRLPQRPKRIVAHVSSAAALWDLGIQPVGVFGPLTQADGSTTPQAGSIDPSKVTSVGKEYSEFNLDTFASLRPDLVVSTLYGNDGTLWYLPQKIASKVEKLCPTVGIDVAGLSLPKPIGRYIDLASALRTSPPSVEQAKHRFEQASADVRAAAEDKSDLKVVAVSGSPQYLYVVRPKGFAALRYLTDLGVNVEEGGGSSPSFQALSWEQADKYPADLIMYDIRPQAMSLDELKAKPTFAKLPAVKAGQLLPWPIDTRCTYEGWAPVLEDVHAGIRSAKSLV